MASSTIRPPPLPPSSSPPTNPAPFGHRNDVVESTTNDDEVTSQWLTSQINTAEQKLKKNESLLVKIRTEKKSVIGAKGSHYSAEGVRMNTNDGEEAMMELKTVVSNPVERLSKLRHELEYLTLMSDLASWSEKHQKTPPCQQLRDEVKRLTSLGRLLLRHSPAKHDGGSAAAVAALYRKAVDEYQSLHRYVRARCVTNLRRYIRKSGYPNEKGCVTIGEEMERYIVKVEEGNSLTGGDPSSDDMFFDDDEENNVAYYSAYLIEIHYVHDHVGRHLNLSLRNDERRIDVLDEFCRPVVERVQFHFLDVDDNNSGEEKDPAATQQHRITTERIDRLPEWVFKFLRDVLTSGVWELIVEYVQPLMETVWTMSSSVKGSASAAAEVIDGGVILPSSHHPPPPPDAPSYVLREMTLLASHVLQRRNFFRHPIIAGPNSNPLLLSQAMEQLLQFDSFIMKLRSDVGRNNNDDERDGNNDVVSGQRAVVVTLVPRLMDTFISTDPDLLSWWIQMERDYALSTLFASSTEESQQRDAGVTTDDSIKVSPQNSPLFSPKSELFVALLHSTRYKSYALSNIEARKQYVAGVIVPLCMNFMEAIHGSATELRSLLVQKRRKGSGAVNTGGGLPSDDDLVKNVMGWIDVITGANLASVALLGRRNRNKKDKTSAGADLGGTPSHASTDEDLDRIGRSMERLRDVVVDEFGTAFVETILMERAKMASYLMRCPHLLSMTEGEVEGGVSSSSLSPDLNEVSHVLRVMIRVCEETLMKASATLIVGHDDGDTKAGVVDVRGGGDVPTKKGEGISSVMDAPKERPPAQMSTTTDTTSSVVDVAKFAPRAILHNVANRIEDKFMEIALDSHGMTPDIGWNGAIVFRTDVHILASLFGITPASGESVPMLSNRGITTAAPPAASSSSHHWSFFHHLLDVVNLMAMDQSQFDGLREVLKGLVLRSSTSASLGMEGVDVTTTTETREHHQMLLSYDDFASDGTVLEEAYSMVKAKGYMFLRIEDVISIMNRRK